MATPTPALWNVIKKIYKSNTWSYNKNLTLVAADCRT